MVQELDVLSNTVWTKQQLLEYVQGLDDDIVIILPQTNLHGDVSLGKGKGRSASRFASLRATFINDIFKEPNDIRGLMEFKSMDFWWMSKPTAEEHLNMQIVYQAQQDEGYSRKL